MRKRNKNPADKLRNNPVTSPESSFSQSASDKLIHKKFYFMLAYPF
jgi:hypothetical protein